jgi:hypothetical protein
MDRDVETGDTEEMDALSSLLLAIGTALEPDALTRVADELEKLPAADAADLANLVRELAELREAGRAPGLQ